MLAPNRTYLAPALLVDELVRAGVHHACVTPGSRSSPVTIALATHPGLRVWTHLDERAAGFFALGLARATRSPVALACTSGTAAANLLPAVIEAFQAHVPLVVLTANRPPELRDCGAPQTIDQHRLFGSHVRWFFELPVPEASLDALRTARTIACRAVATACAAPAGPVHLDLPLREPLAPDVVPNDIPPAVERDAAAGGRPGAPWVRIHDVAPVADPAAVIEIGAMLAQGRRPAIVAGPLDDPDPSLPDAVATLALRLGAPVLAEPASNLRHPTVDPVLVDAHDALLRVDAFRDAHRPDVVLRLGALPTSKAVGTWLAQDPALPQVVLDAGGGWTDPAGIVSAVVRGAPAGTLRALADTVTDVAPDPHWLWRWRRAGCIARRALRAALYEEPAAFEGRVIATLAEVLPADAILYAGNSLAIRDLDWFWPAGAPAIRFLCNRGANGIDGFVSSVLGAAADAARPTVGLCGDLSFLHDVGGLLASHRHGVRAVFIVLDNDGGGIFDHLPVAGLAPRYEELFVTPHGLDLAPIVEAYGARAVRIAEPAALGGAVAEALCGSRTTVLHVTIDRAHSLAAHRRAWRRAAGSLGLAA
jgi:2-succinyl-5-enolpyruvyl-6-hydroxy-3-cyclohexene-1-carboxylate synthase